MNRSTLKCSRPALNRLALWVGLALVLGPQQRVMAAVTPEALPATRYAKLGENCPFGVATAPVQDPNKGAEPVVDLFVSAAAQFRDVNGDERNMVTIKSRADQSTFTLRTGAEPNKEGYSLSSVTWDRVGKTKVTIKKGNEIRALEFDQAAVLNPVAPGPKGVHPVQPRMPVNGMPANGAPPNGVRPSSPVPAPRSPAAFQPPGGAQPAQPAQGAQGGQPAQGAQPETPRRRIRAISSQP